MKKALNFAVLLAIGFALLIAAAPANAQTNSLRFEIPFPFLAGDHALPAGSYVVTVDTAFRVLDLRSVESALSERIMVSVPNLDRAARDRDRGFLRFTERGGQYVLGAVWTKGATDGFPVAAPKASLELARNAGAHRVEIESGTR